MCMCGRSDDYCNFECYCEMKRCHKGDYYIQDHVHDYAGTTACAGEKPHDHRFCGATGRAIPVGCGKHVHRYFNKTSRDLGHDHLMMGTTGIDISVPGGHVHDDKSVTSFDRGHKHKFKFITSKARRVKRKDICDSYDSYSDYDC